MKRIKNIKETIEHGRLNIDDSSIILTGLNGILWQLERMETYIKNMLEGPECNEKIMLNDDDYFGY